MQKVLLKKGQFSWHWWLHIWVTQCQRVPVDQKHVILCPIELCPGWDQIRFSNASAAAHRWQRRDGCCRYLDSPSPWSHEWKPSSVWLRTKCGVFSRFDWFHSFKEVCVNPDFRVNQKGVRDVEQSNNSFENLVLAILQGSQRWQRSLNPLATLHQWDRPRLGRWHLHPAGRHNFYHSVDFWNFSTWEQTYSDHRPDGRRILSNGKVLGAKVSYCDTLSQSFPVNASRSSTRVLVCKSFVEPCSWVLELYLT